MNTYKCFYRGKSIDIEAVTSYSAQQQAAAEFKAKRPSDVTVVLMAKNGVVTPVSTASL